jgi:hypothetical protein
MGTASDLSQRMAKPDTSGPEEGFPSMRPGALLAEATCKTATVLLPKDAKVPASRIVPLKALLLLQKLADEPEAVVKLSWSESQAAPRGQPSLKSRRCYRDPMFVPLHQTASFAPTLPKRSAYPRSCSQTAAVGLCSTVNLDWG